MLPSPHSCAVRRGSWRKLWRVRLPPVRDDQNKQNDKESFLARTRAHPEDMYLKSSRVNPLARYEIKAGWDIPATLEQMVNSDLPGEIKALVRSNVYDTATGRYLLIPQGSRLIGTYNHRVAYGQRGIQVDLDEADLSRWHLDQSSRNDRAGCSGPIGLPRPSGQSLCAPDRFRTSDKRLFRWHRTESESANKFVRLSLHVTDCNSGPRAAARGAWNGSHAAEPGYSTDDQNPESAIGSMSG